MRDRLLATLHATLLGAWLGAAGIVAFGVAPAAFEALPTRSAAGTFVGGVLRIVYAGAVIAGIVGAAVVGRRRGKRQPLRLALAGVIAVGGAAGLAMAAKIASLRAELGPIDALPPDDPGRRTFGALHGISVVVLLVGMVAALAAIALEAATEPPDRYARSSISSRSEAG